MKIEIGTLLRSTHNGKIYIVTEEYDRFFIADPLMDNTFCEALYKSMEYDDSWEVIG